MANFENNTTRDLDWYPQISGANARKAYRMLDVAQAGYAVQLPARRATGASTGRAVRDEEKSGELRLAGFSKSREMSAGSDASRNAAESAKASQATPPFETRAVARRFFLIGELTRLESEFFRSSASARSQFSSASPPLATQISYACSRIRSISIWSMAAPFRSFAWILNRRMVNKGSMVANAGRVIASQCSMTKRACS
jgi:hypothetical protein